LTELGRVSQAILDYVNGTAGYLTLYMLIREVSLETRVRHTEGWWFRRLVALALEGRIKATVYRNHDDLNIRFRRLPDA